MIATSNDGSHLFWLILIDENDEKLMEIWEKRRFLVGGFSF